MMEFSMVCVESPRIDSTQFRTSVAAVHGADCVADGSSDTCNFYGTL